MRTSEPFKGLLDTKLNRKEFLLYLGTVAVALTGIHGVKNTLMRSAQPRVEKRNGYSAGPYGG